MSTRLWEALQLITGAFDGLELADWGVIVSLIVAPFALASAVLAGLPLWLQWRKQRLLEQHFGAEFFDAAMIERSTRYYVEPHCGDIDPTHEAELRRTFPVRERLFDAIDRFLSDEAPHKHCIILADSGMGKSSFVLNYYARNQNQKRSKRQRLAVVPLSARQALNHIKTIDHPQETVLFLDAFDEDTGAITDHEQRLYDLMGACERFKRVLITCRTQFFPSAQEIPEETGLIQVGPRGQGEPGGHIFWKLYLSPLDDNEVRLFLRRRYRWDHRMRQRAQDAVATIPLLSVRPMLLSYIPDVLASEQRITSAYDLYEVMVEKWIEREQPWVDADALRSFSEQLAVKLYAERQERGFERIPHAELQDLAAQWGIALKDWQLRGRSLLNRDAEGNYKFAHRSIMEYLALKRFLQGERPAQRLPLTDQMSMFLRDRLAPHIDLQQSYLAGVDLKAAGLQGVNLQDADLESANLQGADLQGAHLQRANLAQADLRDANLQGANLQGAVVSWEGLKNAIYDTRTRWPDGVDHLSPGVVEWDTHLPMEWTNGLGMVFVQIPAGTFLMGAAESATGAHASPSSEHAVWLLKPFYLGKYPVTRGQWEAVMGSNPSHFTGDPDRPVEQVSWEEAQAFLKALNQIEAGGCYRLPTEAQWEYACRSGSQGAYFFGDDEGSLADYAWCNANSDGRTHAVGQKAANPWNVHDMHGNVWEWVEDWYGPFSANAQVNPSGPESGSDRVLRGGSWSSDAVRCRSSIRGHGDPRGRGHGVGFRLARIDPLPSASFSLGGADENQRRDGLEFSQASANQAFRPFQVFQDPMADGESAPGLVYIPGGAFTIGDVEGNRRFDEQPAHEVMLGAFAMGRYPVTVAEYMRFVDSVGRHHPEWWQPGGERHLETGSDDLYRRIGASLADGLHPVVGVSWNDAAAYCEWLSEQTGKPYQLPTEAQWEYACRAGSSAAYCFGGNAGQLDDYAWHHGNTEAHLLPVGEKRPNVWGLYDMHGLVWEWVGDWYGPYSADARLNPSGPESGSTRVLRGGSWNDGAGNCRSSIRLRYAPGRRDRCVGFRLARQV